MYYSITHQGNLDLPNSSSYIQIRVSQDALALSGKKILTDWRPSDGRAMRFFDGILKSGFFK
jgi:hypothetical protein